MTTHKLPDHLGETVKKAIAEREATVASVTTSRDNAKAFAERRRDLAIAKAKERYDADVKLYDERCEEAKRNIDARHQKTLDRVRDAMGLPGLAGQAFTVTDEGGVEISTEE